MDYNPFKRKMTDLSRLSAEKGNVLIAEPFMQDPYFKRSVVLLTEHNAEGTVGLILNSELDIKLNDIIPDFPEVDNKVFLGGPVQPQNLFFLHDQQHLPAAEEIADGIFWNGDFDLLKSWISRGKVNTNRIRFFLGYSGWEVKQLENEIKMQSWLISQLENDTILNNETDQLWKTTLQNMGKEQSVISNFPEDPTLN